MARTTRKQPKYRYTFPDGETHESPIRNYKGGMTMSPRSCGVWDDDRPAWHLGTGSARKGKFIDLQRRYQKRIERRRIRKQIEEEM